MVVLAYASGGSSGSGSGHSGRSCGDVAGVVKVTVTAEIGTASARETE